MSVYIDPKGVSHKVTHVLADGTRLDDISGHFIPNNPENAGIYLVLAGIAERLVREARGKGKESGGGAS